MNPSAPSIPQGPREPAPPEPGELPTLAWMRANSSFDMSRPGSSSCAHTAVVLAWSSYANRLDAIAAEMLAKDEWSLACAEAFARSIEAVPAKHAEAQRVGSIFMHALGNDSRDASLRKPSPFRPSRIDELGGERFLLETRKLGGLIEMGRSGAAGWNWTKVSESSRSAWLSSALRAMKAFEAEGTLAIVKERRALALEAGPAAWPCAPRRLAL